MQNCEPQNETVSVEEAAAALATTPLNVLLHLKRGVLRGTDVSGDWRIEIQSLAAAIKQRHQGSTAHLCRHGCAAKSGCGTSCG